jgi:hypothetical protein
LIDKLLDILRGLYSSSLVLFLNPVPDIRLVDLGILSGL